MSGLCANLSFNSNHLHVASKGLTRALYRKYYSKNMAISCITCLHGVRRHSLYRFQCSLEVEIKNNAKKCGVKGKGGTNMVKKAGGVIFLHASVM